MILTLLIVEVLLSEKLRRMKVSRAARLVAYKYGIQRLAQASLMLPTFHYRFFNSIQLFVLRNVLSIEGDVQ